MIATIAALLLLAAPSAAAGNPPNPANNIPLGPMPGSCAPGIAEPPEVCANGVIYYLDQARADLGLPPYNLPANFLQLPAEEQIFILSNLDRAAYSLPLVVGLNSSLDEDALVGVRQDEDPDLLRNGSNWPYPSFGWTGNWAGGFPSTLTAYYEWMYDDGYGGTNGDCKTPESGGCWGHRQDTLWSGGEGLPANSGYAMGAATGKDQQGEMAYAMLIVGLFNSEVPPYYYTWSQAVADGAGTHVYPVSPPITTVSIPPITTASIHVNIQGRGFISGSFTCHHSCTRVVSSEESVTLLAHPRKGFRIGGWHGACGGVKGNSCQVSATSDQELSVIFLHKRSRRHKHVRR